MKVKRIPKLENKKIQFIKLMGNLNAYTIFYCLIQTLFVER